MALKIAENRDCGIDTTGLTVLCETVAKASGRPIPAAKPVTGTAVLTHESGIHCHGILADKQTYELFSAAMIGGTEPEFVFGKRSGTASLQYILGKQGYQVSRTEAKTLLVKLRELSIRKKGPCSLEEIITLYQETIPLTK